MTTVAEATANAQAAQARSDAANTAADNAGKAAGQPINDPVPGAQKDLDDANGDVQNATQNLDNSPDSQKALADALKRQREAMDALTQARADLAAAKKKKAELEAARDEARRTARAAEILAAAALVAVQNAKDAEALAALRSRLGEIKSKSIAPSGAKLTTELGIDWNVKGDWYQFILGKWERKVEGSEHKLVLGHGNAVHIGPKVDVMVGAKQTWINGAEVKVNVGANVTTVMGYKSDVVIGEKKSMLLGPKFESHLGTKVTIGDAEQSRAAPSKLNLKAEYLIHNAEEKFNAASEEKVSVKSEYKVSDLKAKIDKLVQEFKDVVEKSETEKTLDIGEYKCEGERYDVNHATSFLAKAGGTMLIKGPAGHAEFSSGHAQIKHESNSVECNGSKTTVRGTEVKFE